MGSRCSHERLLRGRLRGGLGVRWAAKNGCDGDACGVSQGCAGQPRMAATRTLAGGPGYAGQPRTAATETHAGWNVGANICILF